MLPEKKLFALGKILNMQNKTKQKKFSDNEALKKLQPPFALSSGYQAVGFHHDSRLLVFTF